MEQLLASTCPSYGHSPSLTEHAYNVRNLIMAEMSKRWGRVPNEDTCGLEAIAKQRKMLLATVI